MEAAGIHGGGCDYAPRAATRVGAEWIELGREVQREVLREAQLGDAGSGGVRVHLVEHAEPTPVGGAEWAARCSVKSCGKRS
jgi:hypothetical protein